MVVDATSAETGNRSRDKKMHAKVLRSGEQPSIVLRPRRIEGRVATTGASEVTLVGSIELAGVSHPVEIPLTVEVAEGRLSVGAELEIPYVAWGLRNPSTILLRVAKRVTVRVTAEGTITVLAAAPAAN